MTRSSHRVSAISQLSLFSHVLHAYTGRTEGHELSKADLYAKVASDSAVDDLRASARVPVGSSRSPRNLFHRDIRWHQQTLKHAGILKRLPDARGVWQLAEKAEKDLHALPAGMSLVAYSTTLGVAILGSCDTVFAAIDAPIVLSITSPPYPLAQARRYGNVEPSVYIDWICKMLAPVVRNLVPGGSICLNIGNDVFEPGLPSRSLYRERLVIALCDRFGLHKMDELIWHNASKPPGPVRWASIERTQLNVSYEPVYWFTNDPARVRSNNRRVLQAHTDKHLKLINAGGEANRRHNADGSYRTKAGAYGLPTVGKIPRNVLSFGHSCASQLAYKQNARAMGLPAHGAPMPLSLASFLVEFLSEPDDLVADPFGGSFTTALAAERLGRRWMSTEIMVEYVLGSATRFRDAPGFENLLAA